MAHIRVIRLENIGWLNFLANKQTFIPLAKYETISRHTLFAKDILFSSFVAEDVRVCMLPNNLDGSAINKADCFCIRAKEEICDPRFLLIRLACRSTYQQFKESVHGATRPRINLGQLKAFVFDLPTPEEQKEIIHRVESLFEIADKVQEQYEAARMHVDKLIPALLAKAFRGELVPQDTTDEPAEQLLARIQTGAISAKSFKQKRETKAPTKKQSREKRA